MPRESDENFEFNKKNSIYFKNTSEVSDSKFQQNRTINNEI